MRKITAREAGRYAARLDRIANTLENDYKSLGLTQKQALDFAFEVDRIAGLIEAESKKATVLQADPDEPYMPAHFDVAGVMDGTGDPDEPYMALFGDTPGRPANENDSTVSLRTEAAIPDLNPYSDGFKKQPSQPSIGGSPFPGPYPQKKQAADLEGKRYVPQTPATKK